MSRGLGALQRGILEALKLGPADMCDVAEHVTGEPVETGSSAYEATRQAIQGLVRRGLVRQGEGRRERHKVIRSNGDRSWRTLFELS